MGGKAILRIAEKTVIALAVFGLLAALWWLAVLVFAPPPFLVPGPVRVAAAAYANLAYLAENAWVTLVEMLVGLAVGSAAGIAAALIMARSRLAERIVLPAIVTTQTLPVFAIAPLLVIWFGFGLGSKVIMAALIIFFPVASSFFDGLQKVERSWLDLPAGWGASPTQTMLKIKVPAALPSLASGLKIAATLAPIGAVVGEWAGAAAGLGFVMLQANARMQTDLVFASVILLAIMAWALRAAICAVLDRIVFWQGQS